MLLSMSAAAITKLFFFKYLIESASTTDQHQSITGPAETEHSGPVCVHWCTPGGGPGTVGAGGW